MFVGAITTEQTPAHNGDYESSCSAAHEIPNSAHKGKNRNRGRNLCPSSRDLLFFFSAAANYVVPVPHISRCRARERARSALLFLRLPEDENDRHQFLANDAAAAAAGQDAACPFRRPTSSSDATANVIYCGGGVEISDGNETTAHSQSRSRRRRRRRLSGESECAEEAVVIVGGGGGGD